MKRLSLSVTGIVLVVIGAGWILMNPTIEAKGFLAIACILVGTFMYIRADTPSQRN